MLEIAFAFIILVLTCKLYGQAEKRASFEHEIAVRNLQEKYPDYWSEEKQRWIVFDKGFPAQKDNERFEEFCVANRKRLHINADDYAGFMLLVIIALIAYFFYRAYYVDWSFITDTLVHIWRICEAIWAVGNE